MPTAYRDQVLSEKTLITNQASRVSVNLRVAVARVFLHGPGSYQWLWLSVRTVQCIQLCHGEFTILRSLKGGFGPKLLNLR